MTNESGIITIKIMGKVKIVIKLKNRLTDLNKIKKAVSDMSKTVNCSKRKFKEIDLILEELFANVVCHGFNDDAEHDIELSLSCDDTVLVIRMEDDGKPFDLTTAPGPDTECAIEKRCVGGLGIHFVKYFIDECRYYRERDKNIVVLKKYITNTEKQETDSASK